MVLSSLFPNSAANLVCLQHEPAFLYVSQSVKLDEKQRQQVEQIRAAHGDLDIAYDLTQTFVSMLAEHRDTDLDGWMACTSRTQRHSRTQELRSWHPARLRRRARHFHFRVEQWSR